MASIDDNRVISRVLAGDREAFGSLVNKYQPGILSLAWGMLAERGEAEDAAQDAFFRAYQNLKTFDPSREFKNWLYAIAYKRCLDRIRRARIERKYRPNPAVERVFVEDRDPLAGGSPESSPVLKAAWARLGARERSALSLSVVEGFSAAEIAEVLDCAESTVRVTVHNAKKKMRKWLEGNPHV